MIIVLIINIKTDETLFAALPIAHMSQKRFQTKYPGSPNLVPRAHVPFGQHQDTELWEDGVRIAIHFFVNFDIFKWLYLSEN